MYFAPNQQTAAILGGRAGLSQAIHHLKDTPRRSFAYETAASSTGSVDGTNRSVANQTTTISTSPIEHAKLEASVHYCKLLKIWEAVGAIQNEEKEICCRFYVKRACNETVDPDELKSKLRVCEIGSSGFFEQVCVIKEKLPPNSNVDDLT